MQNFTEYWSYCWSDLVDKNVLLRPPAIKVAKFLLMSSPFVNWPGNFYTGLWISLGHLISFMQNLKEDCGCIIEFLFPD